MDDSIRRLNPNAPEPVVAEQLVPLSQATLWEKRYQQVNRELADERTHHHRLVESIVAIIGEMNPLEQDNVLDAIGEKQIIAWVKDQGYFVGTET